MNNLTRMMAFAKQHDWGNSARIVGNALQVCEYGSNECVLVRTMSELRAWAGY